MLQRRARLPAATLAILGSGWQAGSHLPAKGMSAKVSTEVRPADSAEEAVRDADNIATTTNPLTRVVSPDWVRPGIHLTCVRVPELGDETIRKIDRLVIHSHQHAPENYIAGFGDEGIESHDAIDIIRKGPAQAREFKVEHPFWLSAPELRDLIAGETSPHSRGVGRRLRPQR